MVKGYGSGMETNPNRMRSQVAGDFRDLHPVYLSALYNTNGQEAVIERIN